VVFILYPDALDAAKKLPSPSSEELDWKDAGSFSETDNQWAWIAFMSVVLIFHFLMFLLLLAPCCRTVPLCFGLFRKVPEDIRKEARNSLPRNVQLVSSPSYNAAKPTIAQELKELNELKKTGGISADDYNIIRDRLVNSNGESPFDDAPPAYDSVEPSAPPSNLLGSTMN